MIPAREHLGTKDPELGILIPLGNALGSPVGEPSATPVPSQPRIPDTPCLPGRGARGAVFPLPPHLWTRRVEKGAFMKP